MSEVTLETQSDSVDIKLTKPPSDGPIGPSQRSWKDILLFSWAHDFIKLSMDKHVVMEDVIELNGGEAPDEIEGRITDLGKAYYYNRDSFENKAEGSTTKRRGLFTTWIWVFKKEFITTGLLTLGKSVCTFSTPFLIQAIIEFIQNLTEPSSVGLTLVGLVLLAQLGEYLLQQHILFNQFKLGAQSTNAVAGMVFKKILRTEGALLSQGEIANLIQNDADSLKLITTQMINLVEVPLILIIAFVALLNIMGMTVIVGIVIFYLALAFNKWIGKIIKGKTKDYMEAKDARLKLMGEAVQNIKAVKLQSWTDRYVRFISQKRDMELQALKKIHKWNQYLMGGNNFFPNAMMAAIFTVHIGFGNRISLSQAFTVMLFFGMIKQPIDLLSAFITQLAQVRVSMKRLEEFLDTPDVDHEDLFAKAPNTEDDNETSDYAIKISKSNFSWKRQSGDSSPNHILASFDEEKSPSRIQFLLRDIELEVKKGDLVFVVGEIGCGKSALLQTLIGQLTNAGEGPAPIWMEGSLAYCAQEPWIQNTTLRNNIIFGQNIDYIKYEETMASCQLEQDLDSLQAGDQTEIGERGINLSGGQRARIGLARALYSDRDIYLLDDPFSALDPQVRNTIFSEVLIGKLHDRTRIVATHAMDLVQSCPEAKIIVLDSGRIVSQGTFNEVKHCLPREVSSAPTSSINPQQKKTSPPTSQRSSNPQKKQRKGRLTTNEDEEGISITGAHYWKLLKMAGGPQSFLAFLAFMCLLMYVNVQCNYILGLWCNSETQGRDLMNFGTQLFQLSALAGCVAWTHRKILNSMNRALSRNLHSQISDSVLEAPVNIFFDVTPSGLVLNRFSKDMSQIDAQMRSTVSQISLILVGILAVFLIVIATNVILFLAFPFLIGVTVWMLKFAMRAFKEGKRVETVSWTPVLNCVNETHSGTSTIRAFRKEKEFEARMYRLLNLNCLANDTQIGAWGWYGARMGLLQVAILAFVMIVLVLNRAHEDIVLVSMVLLYSTKLQGGFLQLQFLLGDLELKMVSVARCMNFLDIPQEQKTLPPLQGTPGGDSSREFLDSERSPEQSRMLFPSWPGKEASIEFNNVKMRYRPNTDLILKNTSFTIEAGTSVGVVGRTGAGKSTLSMALMRLTEIEAGSICISGVDIRTIPLSKLRRAITLIPQDPTLFTGTLKANLDPEGQSSADELMNLIKDAGLDQIVARHADPESNPLDFMVENSGANLSAGEKQLVCIARALLRQTKILILDEATANIDLATEARIQELLSSKFQQSTIMTIAHRLKTVQKYDEIMVIDNGQVIEKGQPTELQARKDGFFRKLVRSNSEFTS